MTASSSSTRKYAAMLFDTNESEVRGRFTVEAELERRSPARRD